MFPGRVVLPPETPRLLYGFDTVSGTGAFPSDLFLYRSKQLLSDVSQIRPILEPLGYASILP